MAAKKDSMKELPPGVIAQMVMRDNHYITLKDSRNNATKLYYDKGAYHYGGDADIKEKTNEICQTSLTRQFMNEVIFQVEVNTLRWRNEIDADPHIFNLQNGLLDTDTMQLMPHDPEYPSIIQSPVIYDKTADCPAIKKFLSEILQPKDIPVIEELFGYCLLKDQPYQRAFLFIGKGENGKSVLLELIRQFLGKDNCSAIAWQTLEENRFSLAQLKDKLANIYADLKIRAINDTGNFKTLTGQDTMTAEQKYEEMFQFKSFAKLIFSCNQPPVVTSDDSLAFWRRWILVEFPRQFRPEERDINLISKLTTDQELSGLLNLAIKGLKRLREQGDFSYGTTPEDVAKTYKIMSDSVQSFLSEEYCQYGNDLYIGVDDLYNYYETFCRIYKLNKKDKVSFGRRLAQLHPDIRKSRRIVDKKQVTLYEGVNCDGVQLLIETPEMKFGLSQEYKDLSPEAQKVVMAINEELEMLKEKGIPEAEIQEYAQESFEKYFEVNQ